MNNTSYDILQKIGSRTKGITEIHPVADLSVRDLHFYLRCMVADGYLSASSNLGPYSLTLTGHDVLSDPNHYGYQVDEAVNDSGEPLCQETKHEEQDVKTPFRHYLPFLLGLITYFLVEHFFQI